MADVNQIDEIFKKYKIDKEIGFLLPSPSLTLPKKYKAWIELNNESLNALENGTIRQLVDKLPILSIDELTEYNDLRFAHLLLANIMQMYIWCDGEDQACMSLPEQIARPLVEISDKIGLVPMLCHADACLANYRLIDTTDKPYATNMLLLAKFIKAYDNDWFFVNTAQVEIDFGPCLLPIIESIQYPKWRNVENCLKKICNCLIHMKLTLSRMPDYLDPNVFYHGFRHFLGGYTGQKFKENGGIFFEGIDKKFQWTGGSAAQSSTIQVLDAYLFVKHRNQFLLSQREYMPDEHRKFIEFVEENTPMKILLKEEVIESDFIKLYNTTLDRLTEFRSEHLKIVTRFIIVPRASGKSKVASLDQTGTGGTDLIRFLKEIRKDTVDSII